MKNKSFLVFIGIIIILIGSFLILYTNSNKNELNEKIKNDILSSFPEELYDYETYHHNFAQKCLTENCEEKDNFEYTIVYQSKINNYINLDKINIDIKNKKIIVTLPEIEIKDFEFIDTEMVSISEESTLPKDKKEIIKLCKNDLQEKIDNNNKSVFDDSYNAILPRITEFLESWVKKNYSDYKLEVK